MIEFEIIENIQGTVYSLHLDGLKVVAKRFRSEKDRKEIANLCRVSNHPNILKMMWAIQLNNCMMINIFQMSRVLRWWVVPRCWILPFIACWWTTETKIERQSSSVLVFELWILPSKKFNHLPCSERRIRQMDLATGQRNEISSRSHCWTRSGYLSWRSQAGKVNRNWETVYLKFPFQHTHCRRRHIQNRRLWSVTIDGLFGMVWREEIDERKYWW